MLIKIVQCAVFGVMSVMSVAVSADTGAIGIWKTEPVANIGYLYINIEPCNEHLCGTITSAFNPEGEPNLAYEHLGKDMVWNMSQKSEMSWGGGKIWDPRGSKIYKSKMTVDGDLLRVSGCFLMFCSGQDWVRVK